MAATLCRVTTRELLGRLAPDGRITRTAGGWLLRCPAHADSTPSLSVAEGERGALLRCFAGCSTENICAAAGLRLADLFADAPQGKGEGWKPLPSRPRVERDEAADAAEKAARRARWPSLDAPTPAELEALAALRTLTVRGLRLAANRGLLRFCDWQGCRCWCVVDSSRRAGQVRRLDGSLLRAADGTTKAMTLPGSLVRWPVGLPGIESARRVLVTEGGPDFLAAHTFIYAENARDSAAVCMLGAGLSIHDDALTAFAGKSVRILAQADTAG